MAQNIIREIEAENSHFENICRICDIPQQSTRTKKRYEKHDKEYRENRNFAHLETTFNRASLLYRLINMKIQVNFDKTQIIIWVRCFISSLHGQQSNIYKWNKDLKTMFNFYKTVSYLKGSTDYLYEIENDTIYQEEEFISNSTTHQPTHDNMYKQINYLIKKLIKYSNVKHDININYLTFIVSILYKEMKEIIKKHNYSKQHILKIQRPIAEDIYSNIKSNSEWYKNDYNKFMILISSKTLMNEIRNYLNLTIHDNIHEKIKHKIIEAKRASSRNNYRERRRRQQRIQN